MVSSMNLDSVILPEVVLRQVDMGMDKNGIAFLPYTIHKVKSMWKARL